MAFADALAAGMRRFMTFLDVTIANLALPAVGRDFTVDDIADLSWIVTLYTVVFAALLAPAGRIADVVGRRRLFLVGMAVFVMGSLGAAAAPGLGLLLAARAAHSPISIPFTELETLYGEDARDGLLPADGPAFHVWRIHG